MPGEPQSSEPLLTDQACSPIVICLSPRNSSQETLNRVLAPKYEARKAGEVMIQRSTTETLGQSSSITAKAGKTCTLHSQLLLQTQGDPNPHLLYLVAWYMAAAVQASGSVT